MARAKYTPPKIKDTITIPGECELNRFRHLLIKFDSTPIDSSIIPPALSGLDVAKLQEIWIYGLEIESVWEEPNNIHSYTGYADALMKTIYNHVKLENIEEVDNPTTTVYPGRFVLFSLGIGTPEQVRLIGPLTAEQHKKFSHPRVFREFVNIITPVTHLAPSTCKAPEILGTLDDMEALSSYAAPSSFSDFLKDHTSGLMVKIGEQVLETLEKGKASMSELERANGRLQLLRLKKSISDNLVALGI